MFRAERRVAVQPLPAGPSSTLARGTSGLHTGPMRIDQGIDRRPVHRLSGGRWVADEDEVVVEAPLQIRLAGEPFVTTMRTPGDDEALALGLLWSEGVIADLDDISAIVRCGERGDAVLDVRPGPGVAFDFDRLRRGTLTNASCGVCGRAQIADLLARVEPLQGLPVALSSVRRAAEKLRGAQPRFTRTGALHAAGIADAEGKLVTCAEDVGRHNAVDKAVGAMLQRGSAGRILIVSGRTSFEIVQKAACARLPVVASVGGPTSLAIDLAAQAGVALVGFLRGDRCNVYTHPELLGAPANAH